MKWTLEECWTGESGCQLWPNSELAKKWQLAACRPRYWLISLGFQV